jgi:hypothetical protein
LWEIIDTRLRIGTANHRTIMPLARSQWLHSPDALAEAAKSATFRK